MSSSANSLDEFFSKEYKTKKEIYSYIKNHPIYGFNKTLKENPSSYRSSYKVDYICTFPNCCFRVVSTCGRIGLPLFKFDLDKTCLNHYVFNPLTNERDGFCNGVKQPLTSVTF